MTESLTNMIYSIVLIRYPFDDLIDFKIRPVLILSEPITKLNHLITAFITSKYPNPLESSDIFLSADDKDFYMIGLKQHSVVRLHSFIYNTTGICFKSFR